MFFKEKKLNVDKNNYFVKITALLVHAAKIDQNYSKKEEEIIKQTLIKIGVNIKDLEIILKKSIKLEENSNQILAFTKEVKNMNENDKIKIIESLWEIIYSNDEADLYETSLMRRLEGLLYIDNKIMGNIKKKFQSKNSR
tara:strand:+ start:2581 stop:3000 length:420 start_codon:yes stop_codon:yes gene_type:complete